MTADMCQQAGCSNHAYLAQNRPQILITINFCRLVHMMLFETHAAIMVQEPQGWVASFLKERVSDEESLSAHGIYDEASYLAGESELRRRIRHRLGLFRAHYLVGANCDDPCALARAAPPRLAERELLTLDLPVRGDNVFRVREIKTVQDLADSSPESLLRQPNFGRRSPRDTMQALNAALNEGPARNATDDTESESTRLLTEVRRSLLSYA